jgi:hypothetical protein
MLEVKSRKNTLPSLVGKISSSISLRDFWGASVGLVGNLAVVILSSFTEGLLHNYGRVREGNSVRGDDVIDSGRLFHFCDVLCALDMNRR